MQDKSAFEPNNNVSFRVQCKLTPDCNIFRHARPESVRDNRAFRVSRENGNPIPFIVPRLRGDDVWIPA